LSSPRTTILRTLSGNGRCNAFASSHGAHPDVALLLRRQDHRHCLRVDWLDDRHNQAQWGWRCGFYPGSNPVECTSGTAATFDHARADFETGPTLIPRSAVKDL